MPPSAFPTRMSNFQEARFVKVLEDVANMALELSNITNHEESRTSFGIATKRATSVHNYWSRERKIVLQQIGVSTAAVAVVLSAITAYWFVRMRKRFRHNLIMLFILGDLFRTVAMLVIASLSLAHGQIKSSAGICQATGWFTQFGTVMNDWSALALAVHGTLQILRPSVSSVHSVDTMFKYRYFVYAGLVLIPILCASLNYVNVDGIYTAGGAFCMLPVRPLWYRLALAWVPRYIISLIILALSVVVYIHVKKVYAGATNSKWWALSSLAVPKDVVRETIEDENTAPPPLQRGLSRRSIVSQDRFDPFRSDPTSSARRQSLRHARIGTASVRPSNQNEPAMPAVPPSSGGRRRTIVDISTSNSSSSLAPRRIRSFDMPVRQREESRPPPPPSRRASLRPPLTQNPSGASGMLTTVDSIRSSLVDRMSFSSTLRMRRSRAQPTQMDALRVKRAAIRRHLRLTFIYPLIYILMWIAPFALHCMQYDNWYAANPPFGLGIAATCCYTLMAAVDCSIFCYREKPWRHIPTNPGRGFWASFRWRQKKVNRDVRRASVHSEGSERWGSYDDKQGPLDSYRTRRLRGSAETDPPLGVGVIPEESTTASGTGRTPIVRLNTLATIYSSGQDTPSRLRQPEKPSVWRRLSTAPMATADEPQNPFKRFFSSLISHRSDAQKAASEHAHVRLAREQQDRMDVESQRVSSEPDWASLGPIAERNWWDRGRKDSEDMFWSRSRQGTEDGLEIPETNSDGTVSPGLSPGCVPGRTFGGESVGSRHLSSKATTAATREQRGSHSTAATAATRERGSHSTTMTTATRDQRGSGGTLDST